MALHHRPWTARKVGQRWVWHDITALRLHARSDDVGRVITTLPLNYTQGQTWHDIIALGLHTRSNDVTRGMTSPPLDYTHGRITSGVACYHRLLESKHCRMTSGMTCHHRLWTAYTVKLRRAWHAIIAFGQHTRSNNIERGMPSSPLGSIND